MFLSQEKIFFEFYEVKKILIGFLFLNFIVPSKARAQLTETAPVYLDVKGTVTLTKVRDLSMGFVLQGVTSITIDPIIGGSQVAYFVFAGQPNSPVTVSFSSSELTSGSYTIIFTGALAGSGAPDQHNGSLIANGDPVITNSDGEYYFWAGGTADLSPTQPYGIYTGSFTLSIAY